MSIYEINSQNLSIDKSLESLLVPLSQEEFELLKASILKHGCINPLIVWRSGNNSILIDGHNRYRICQDRNIEFRIEYIDFKDVDQAKYWIVNNQLARRNLNPDQISYYRGLKYLQVKRTKGGYINVLSKDQNEPSTSELLGNEFKVSSSTIKRDANYARGIDIIGQSNPDLKLRLLKGEVSFNKRDIQLLGASEKAFRVKNEADLFNKVQKLKDESLGKVETALKNINISEPEEVKLNPFSTYEERVKRVKASILSYINIAIEKKDINAILKLKELIGQLESIITS